MARRKNPPLIVQATETAALCDVIAGKSSPLQHLIAHGIINNPQDLQSKPENILNALLSRSLTDVVEEIENAYLTRDSKMVSVEEVRACFKNLRGHIGQQVQEVLAREEARNADTRLLSRIVGDTALGDYGVTIADDRGWLGAIDEALLIARAKAGDRSAFNFLQPRYKEQVLGPIRPRAHRGDDVEDIEQVAWLLIWEKMPTYDPAYGSFSAFAKTWAEIAPFRYYDPKKETNWLQKLLLDLRDQLKDQKLNPATKEVNALLAAEPGQVISKQDALLCLEGFTKLSSLTVGKCTLPHQVIGVGFVTLLGMKPQRVVKELSDTPLKELAMRLENEYVERTSLTEEPDDYPERVRQYFRPLYKKLEKPFAEVATAKDLKIYPKADFEHLYIRVIRFEDAKKKEKKRSDVPDKPFSSIIKAVVLKELQPSIGETILRDYDKGPKINTEGLGQSSTLDEVKDQTPTPAQALARAEEYDKLLRLAFGSCSPPHQLIALGFVKLLEMKPQQIVKELSHEPLRKLATRLEKDYVQRSQLSPERVGPHFQPLHEKLERPFPEIVTEQRTLDTYPQTNFSRLYDRPSGDTALEDYRTGGLEDNISKWCDSVMRRVWKKWLEEEVQEINPHELIAYGLMKLLGVEPQQVVEQCWDTSLDELTKTLEDEYATKVGLPQESVHPHFQPVYDKLRKPFPDIATEKSLKTYPKARFLRLYDCPCGDTTLSDYCSGEPEDCISQWCDTVELRIGKWPLEWPLEEED